MRPRSWLPVVGLIPSLLWGAGLAVADGSTPAEIATQPVGTGAGALALADGALSTGPEARTGSAQDAGARKARPARGRTSWFLGGSLGTGAVEYEGVFSAPTGSALCFDAYFGGMLGEQLALSVELWSDGNRADERTAEAQNVLGIALRYWLSSRLWLKSGLGSATFVSDEMRRSIGMETLEGVSFLFGGGYEVVGWESWAVDLSLRMLTTGYDIPFWDSFERTTVTAHLGLTWY